MKIFISLRFELYKFEKFDIGVFNDKVKNIAETVSQLCIANVIYNFFQYIFFLPNFSGFYWML